MAIAWSLEGRRLKQCVWLIFNCGHDDNARTSRYSPRSQVNIKDNVKRVTANDLISN